MKLKNLVIFTLFLLLSCDAGTVEVNLSTLVNTQSMSLPLLTDSIEGKLYDTLYVNVKKARLSIRANESRKRLLVRFVRDSGVPVQFKDTVFIEGICDIEVPPYIPVIIFSDSADIYSLGADIRSGDFTYSKVVLDLECDRGPFIFKNSYLEVKVPASCKIKMIPETGALLKTSVKFPVFSIFRYTIDSAKVFFR